MQKTIILVIFSIIIISGCKKYDPPQCTCCPCDTAKKKIVKIEGKHTKIYLRLIDLASGEQLLNAMEKPMMQNLSNEKLKKIRKELRADFVESCLKSPPKK